MEKGTSPDDVRNGHAGHPGHGGRPGSPGRHGEHREPVRPTFDPRGRHTKTIHQGSSPMAHYCLNHSTKLPDDVEQLVELTMSHCRSGMMGAPEVLKLNSLLMTSMGARNAIDVGFFTGLSALTAAHAIADDGIVVACDNNDEGAIYGKPIWSKSKVAHKIDLRIQPALTTLKELIAEGKKGTFDFCFIDADKTNYENYFELCLELLRPKGIMVFDNTLWGGTVLNPEREDDHPPTAALKKLNEKLPRDHRINVSQLAVGDGISIVLKL